MKTSSCAVLLVALGVGAAVFLRPQSAAERRDVAQARSAPVERSSKSERTVLPAGPARHSLPEESEERREGRTWKVAQADPVVMDRLLAQRSAVPPPALERPRDATLDDSATGGSGAGETSPATVRAADFARQVRAQREGRREFMSQRYDELSSHQPGCKCAYHLGEK